MSQLEHLLKQCTVKLSLSGRSGWGTGFFVAPGWILTCAHVVKEAKGEPVQVRWQQQELEAVVERALPDPYDLTLLRVTLPADVKQPPCVYLDEEFSAGHALYAYGYSDEFPEGASLLGECEGEATENNSRLILFKATRVRSGMSGSPLLNLQTKAICGIVKFTRDRSLDLGGGAIPTHIILEQFPQLRELQQEFHRGDRRWSDLLPDMTSQSEMLDAEAVQSYLRSLSHYEWWDVYRLTETISARQATFTFEQIVQTEEPSKENPMQKETAPWPLLQGIIHYAKLEHVKLEHVKSEHVLLVGSPGAGKSTTLLRLLAVLAKQELQSIKPRIPVLVKLKNYQKPVSGAEDSSGMLTLIKEALEPELSLEISEIKTLLFEEKRFFLLLDGLNEIPADTVRSKLTEFRAKCDRANIPLVCTTRNLGETLGIQRRLDLQTLSPREIRRFLRECMLGQEEQILKLLDKGNQELGKTPFILWMLYDIYKKSGQIPESLGEAFSSFTKNYTDYKIHQEGIPVSVEDLQYWNLLLEYLAFEMLRSPDPHDPGLMISERQATGMLLQFPSTEAIDQRQAQSLLNNLLKYHLLQKSHKGEVSFCHQLIQEYYAAEHLRQQLPTLLEDENKFQRDYLNYLKWTEAIALMLSLVEQETQALRIVKLALDVDLMLGARLAGEVKQKIQLKAVSQIIALEVPALLKVRLLYSTHSIHVIPELRKALKSSDFRVREWVVNALWEISSATAIPALVDALDDPIFFISWKAVAALGQIHHGSVVTILVKLLEHPNANLRLRAAYELSQLGHKAGISVLLKFLETPDFSTKKRIISMLKSLDNNISTLTLLEISESKDLATRSLAVEALGMVGDNAIIPALLKSLEHEESRLQAFVNLDEKVIIALGQIGSDSAVIALVDLLTHQNSSVRRKVIEVLGQLGCRLAVPALLKALKEDNPAIQSLVATALGEIGDETAISWLLELLECEEIYVRQSIISAIGKIGSEIAVPKLLLMLEDKDYSIRASASDALCMIGGAEIILELVKTLTSNKSNVREIAVETLGRIGSETEIPILLNVIDDAPEISESLDGIEDENYCFYINSAIALIRLGSDVGASILIKELEHPDFAVRIGSYFDWDLWKQLDSELAIPVLLKALEKQHRDTRECAYGVLHYLLRDVTISEKVLPAAIAALKQSDDVVCSGAISVVRKIGSKSAIPSLLALLEHQNVEIRLTAASVIAEWGYESVIPTLLNFLEYKDDSIRRKAIFGLGDIGSKSAVSELLNILRHTDEQVDVRKTIVEVLERLSNPSYISDLWDIQEVDENSFILDAIETIQKQCKFYNYEIAYGFIPPGKPIALFFSYAPNDEDLRDELEKHLSILKREGVITSWDNRQILPGDEREQVISDRLNTADIILLLISHNSIADDTCYDVEIQRAIERHQAGEACVIPILLRPVDWKGALFSQLTVLPRNQKPVTKWKNQDEAFQEIAEGIREVAIALRKPKG